MTQQMDEELFIDGEPNALFTEPLDSYFCTAGFDPEFDIWCTALWRGYRGTWDITEKRLYLVGLEGRLKDGTDISVSAFFPRQNDRVFAFWYSGILQVPKGRMIESDLMSYRIYENDLFLTVEKGIVVDSNLRHNGIAADPNAEDARFGCSPVAMTFFGKRKSAVAPEAPANNVSLATFSIAEVLDSEDEAEISARHQFQSKFHAVDPWALEIAQTHFPLGTLVHHDPCERFSQPRLWKNYQDVAAFASERALTLDDEIVIQRVKGGWVLPYYLAVWNGYVESEEAVNDREDWFRQSEEIAAANQRDDERNSEDGCDED